MPGLVFVPPVDETPLVVARPAHAHRPGTHIRNRRKRYLELNPSYFSNELEAADPLLYDRLVRKWHTDDERGAERQRGGFAGILERDTQRSEARLDAVQNGARVHLREGHSGQVTADVSNDEDEGPFRDQPDTREGDWARWKSAMESRFVAGNDDDFDYTAVDGNDAYDDSTETARDREDAYFDAEEPEFELRNGHLSGETGVQDY